VKKNWLVSVGLIIFILALISCIKHVDRPARADYSRFFPLNDGDYSIYSGPLGKAVVTQNIGDLFTFTYYDTLGQIAFWRDFIKTDHSVGLKNIIWRKKSMASVHFEPPLPFVPWSDKIGDTLLFSSAEIHGDSINTHLYLQVEYEIYGSNPIKTPAGNFNDCLEIRVTPKTLYEKNKNYLKGDSYFWFARNVGIVKYIIPEGAGELLEAKVDGRTYP
jgi:hypothetical protein